MERKEHVRSQSTLEAITLDVPSPRRPTECPVEDWLAFLDHRWNALILWHLSVTTKRFRDLEDCLPGITPKVLTERLRELERRDLVTRSPLASFPRGMVYELSPRARGIVAILDQIEAWSRASGSKAPN